MLNLWESSSEAGAGFSAALLVFGFFLAYFFPVLKTKLNYILEILFPLFSTL